MTYDFLIVCSFGVNANYILVDNPDYPQIADDYRATFAKARALSVDVFLGAHSHPGSPTTCGGIAARIATAREVAATSVAGSARQMSHVVNPGLG